ncbi:hypothetical protein D3C79_596090 [compost metagenome]
MQQHGTKNHPGHHVADLAHIQADALQVQRQQGIDAGNGHTRTEAAHQARRRNAQQLARLERFDLVQQRRHPRQDHDGQYRQGGEHAGQHERCGVTHVGDFAKTGLGDDPGAVEGDHVQRQQAAADLGVTGQQQPAFDHQEHAHRRPAVDQAQHRPPRDVVEQALQQDGHGDQRGEAGVGADMADAQDQPVVEDGTQGQADEVGRGNHTDSGGRLAGSAQAQGGKGRHEAVAQGNDEQPEQGRQRHGQQTRRHTYL